MRIRMLSTAAGPAGCYQGGAEYVAPLQIEKGLAHEFVRGGCAVLVHEGAEPAPARVAEPETATIAPPENAATRVPPKPKPKPGKAK